MIKYQKLTKTVKEKLARVSADAKRSATELLRQDEFVITLNGNFIDNRSDAGNIILTEVHN